MARPSAAGAPSDLRHQRPFFIPAGAETYKADVPAIGMILFDTRRFTLEEGADTIAQSRHQGAAPCVH